MKTAKATVKHLRAYIKRYKCVFFLYNFYILTYSDDDAFAIQLALMHLAIWFISVHLHTVGKESESKNKKFI